MSDRHRHRKSNGKIPMKKQQRLNNTRNSKKNRLKFHAAEKIQPNVAKVGTLSTQHHQHQQYNHTFLVKQYKCQICATDDLREMWNPQRSVYSPLNQFRTACFSVASFLSWFFILYFMRVHEFRFKLQKSIVDNSVDFNSDGESISQTLLPKRSLLWY